MHPSDHITRWEIVPYFHGRILEISEGRTKTFPHFVSYSDLWITEPSGLACVANGSLDGIMSSDILQRMPEDDIRETLTTWSKKVRNGGRLILHFPQKDRKWEVRRETVVALLDTLVRDWDLSYLRDLESGLLAIVTFSEKRVQGHTFSCDKPEPAKRCGVVRLGAFGDMIQASSILPWLKDQGYHVTLYCSDTGYEVIKHDPHVDRFVIQGKDEVPPQFLGTFYEYEKKKYQKWIDLCESVEGTLLPPPGSSRFAWPDAVRARYLDKNYLEFTHELAEVPPPYRPRFYATPDEREWARQQVKQLGKRNILWSLSGSSVHKTWPHLDNMIARIMLHYTDVHVILVGDELCQILEMGWQREPRVHCLSGKLSIRQSMALAGAVDLIVGNETGLLNAAGASAVPKVVLLSHSSEEMLTKHWQNATALSQPNGIGCQKQPCRQLHHNFDYCPSYSDGKKKSAMCQWFLNTEQVWGAITSVLRAQEKRAAA